jgi:hypothetical protein
MGYRLYLRVWSICHSSIVHLDRVPSHVDPDARTRSGLETAWTEWINQRESRTCGIDEKRDEASDRTSNQCSRQERQHGSLLVFKSRSGKLADHSLRQQYKREECSPPPN